MGRFVATGTSFCASVTLLASLGSKKLTPGALVVSLKSDPIVVRSSKLELVTVGGGVMDLGGAGEVGGMAVVEVEDMALLVALGMAVSA